MLNDIKKISIIGRFAEKENYLNGQTVKTKILYEELQRDINNSILKIDTHGGIKTLLKTPFLCMKALRYANDIIILPAENGLRVIAPLLVVLNVFFHRRLHYDVIGGWLPDFLQSKPVLAKFLRKFNDIYVETDSMKDSLEQMDFKNVTVIPNCKKLQILSEPTEVEVPYKLCTFSRVMREKGIEVAVDAVKMANQMIGENVFSLDIYGQIDANQIDWFESLKKDFPEYINYKGMVSFDQSTDILKEYFALLFPTFYPGEGFAGTLIDAFAAGVPVIASDWKYNREIVKSGVTGIVYEGELKDTLIQVFQNPNRWIDMRKFCLVEAKNYLPEVALEKLKTNIKK